MVQVIMIIIIIILNFLNNVTKCFRTRNKIQ